MWERIERKGFKEGMIIYGHGERNEVRTSILEFYVKGED